jgi:methionyl-tRNA formyltransferase
MMTNLQMKSDLRFAFFGTEPLAIAVLDALERKGFLPALVVASPDRIVRASIIFPPEKEWAITHGIGVMQPKTITPEFIAELAQSPWDVFIVASYGKILPKALRDIPRRSTINLHPSLLPRLRGPSPIRSAILEDEKGVGVSVILLDDKMDHGAIIAQREIATPQWPMHGNALDALLAQEGAELLADVLPHWIDDTIATKEQDHSQATYCKMFTKEEGLIDLAGDPYKNLLKIRAFEGWPGTYAFFKRNGTSIRVNIVDAHIKNEKLIIDTVKPEGKREMTYKEFLRGVSAQ